MAVFLGTLLASGTVIASPAIPDQEATMTSMEAGFDWIALWPVPAAIVALIIFLCLPDTQLRQPRLRQWRWSPNAGLILFGVALLAGMLGSMIALAMTGLDPAELESLDIRSMVFLMAGNYVGQGVVLLLVPGLILGLIMARRNPVDPDRAPVSWWRACLSGIAGLVICWPMVMVVAVLVGLVITLMTGKTLPDIAHGTLTHLQEASAAPDGWFIAVIVLIVLVTPVIEETMYRGLLQESIRRHPLVSGSSPWLAIIFTSLVFALMHGAVVDLRGMLGLFVLSLGFGWVYLKTGRLLASIVMHAAFNVVNLLQVLV